MYNLIRMKFSEIFIFEKYTTKTKYIVFILIVLILILKINTVYYTNEMDYNKNLWIARTTEINELVSKRLLEIYSKIKCVPEEYPIFIEITYIDITFFMKPSINNSMNENGKKITVNLSGLYDKTIKIELVWQKKDAVKLSQLNNQHKTLNRYTCQIQMAEGIVDVAIDEQYIQFHYNALPFWHKKIAIEPPQTIRHLLRTKCREGQTYAWPKNVSIDKYTWNNNPDDDINYKNLPGLHHPEYDLTTYGKCINGSIKQMKCPLNSVYNGGGNCTSCSAEVYTCLTNMVLKTGTYTVPTDKEQSSYYDCIRMAPYVEKKTCETFFLYDGRKCSPAVHDLCRGTYTNKPLPSIFSNEWTYKNSFINCSQPHKPILMKCNETGLNENGTDCKENCYYTYVRSTETFTLKTFLIERNKIDIQSGKTIETLRARIITKREYVYKSIDRSNAKKYNKNIDVYCEYDIPEYYFSSKDRSLKYCTSFRDCRELFKKPKIRVKCPDLDDRLKFCCLSVYVNIDDTSGAIDKCDLTLSYGPPEILTVEEKTQINEMAIVYAGSPVEKSKVYACEDHVNFKISEKYPTLTNPTEAYWCENKWTKTETIFDVFRITNPKMTSNPNEFRVKETILREILPENNSFGYILN